MPEQLEWTPSRHDLHSMNNSYFIDRSHQFFVCRDSTNPSIERKNQSFLDYIHSRTLSDKT